MTSQLAHVTTRQAVHSLATALTAVPTLPPYLDAAIGRLEASNWPEVVWTWSRLTPSGCPIELTCGPYGAQLRWTAEVAGPELPDAHRLRKAVALLEAAGQPLPPDLVHHITARQAKADLRFGAWLGGRENPIESVTRLKLYAELPHVTAHLLPQHVAAAWRRLPPETLPRILGFEPSTGKTELYARLPSIDPIDLLPFLNETDHTSALTALNRHLPDGLDRLTGRRLGISISWTHEPHLELALFVSARTLFPGAPEALSELVPSLPAIDNCRFGLVTFRLDPTGRTLPAAIGLSPGAASRA
jgi:hypothetical protein